MGVCQAGRSCSTHEQATPHACLSPRLPSQRAGYLSEVARVGVEVIGSGRPVDHLACPQVGALLAALQAVAHHYGAAGRRR
jgi:hypothetical protein